MCIAILKKAGKPISKEALYTGWKANNDGAGFACIKEDGEFLIYTTMSWLDFWEKYEQAEKLYGNNSDFLIHFRITSKGSTSLDNCHPFQVDANRVIIHNGTITNVHIDKEDKRSDTKVFAQDWLPHLPENWEDNLIIKLFLEEFIGWSKIVMLHRTKGAYIFNEGRGHWFEDNWYSNDSYVTKQKTTYSDSYAGGYWDSKENKWVTKEDADKKRSEYFSSYYGKDRTKWVRCDKCQWLMDQSELQVVDTPTGEEEWCVDCLSRLTEHIACDFCGISFKSNMIDEYWDYADSVVYNLCVDCAEVIKKNSTIEKLSDLEMDNRRSAK